MYTSLTMNDEISIAVSYTVIGSTDDVDACDCCGRKGLKKTIVLRPDNSTEVVYFGTSCAALAMKRTAKEIKALVRVAEDADRAARERAYREAAAADAFRWRQHIDGLLAAAGKTGTGDLLEDMDAVGGYAAVAATYDYRPLGPN